MGGKELWHVKKLQSCLQNDSDLQMCDLTGGELIALKFLPAMTANISRQRAISTKNLGSI